jgi:hypothetical protein
MAPGSDQAKLARMHQGQSCRAACVHKAALWLGHARAAELKIIAVEMEANTCYSADTLPRCDRVSVP